MIPAIPRFENCFSSFCNKAKTLLNPAKTLKEFVFFPLYRSHTTPCEGFKSSFLGQDIRKTPVFFRNPVLLRK